MWHASCILLGSAMSKVSCVIINAKIIGKCVLVLRNGVVWVLAGLESLCCVLALDKTLYSHSASLHPGVLNKWILVNCQGNWTKMLGGYLLWTPSRGVAILLVTSGKLPGLYQNITRKPRQEKKVHLLQANKVFRVYQGWHLRSTHQLLSVC